jgi:hypothetical protein
VISDSFYKSDIVIIYILLYVYMLYILYDKSDRYCTKVNINQHGFSSGPPRIARGHRKEVGDIDVAGKTYRKSAFLLDVMKRKEPG